MQEYCDNNIMKSPSSFSNNEVIDLFSKKINALLKVNEEISDEIFALRDIEVIYELKHELYCHFDSNWGKGENMKFKQKHHHIDRKSYSPGANYCYSDLWSVETKSKKEKIIRRLEKWRYRGEPLLQLFLIDNKNLDLRINTYIDLPRVNMELRSLFTSYQKHLIDEKHDISFSYRRLLHNLEIVQCALGELHSLTFDVQNSLFTSRSCETNEEENKSNNLNTDISHLMSTMVSSFISLSNLIPNASLEIKASIEDKNFISSYRSCLPKFNDHSLIKQIKSIELRSDEAIFALEGITIPRRKYDRVGTLDDSSIFMNQNINKTGPSSSFVAANGSNNTIKLLKLQHQTSTTSNISNNTNNENSIYHRSKNNDKMCQFEAKLFHTFVGHKGVVKCLRSFYNMNDGSYYLVSSADDSTIKVWNLTQVLKKETQSVISRTCFTLVDHKDSVSSLAVYEPTLLICSGSNDKTIKRWRVCKDNSKGSLIETMEVDYWVTCLEIFEKDGPYLVSTGWQKKIDVWKLGDMSSPSILVYTFNEFHSPVHSFTIFQNENNEPILGCINNSGIDEIMQSWSLDSFEKLNEYRNKSSSWGIIRTIKTVKMGQKSCFVSAGDHNRLEIAHLDQKQNSSLLHGNGANVDILSLAIIWDDDCNRFYDYTTTSGIKNDSPILMSGDSRGRITFWSEQYA
eukprot:CAMPEP_0178963018 /NCGR_PEP_ID=MMETSP0789-20121207/14748_1 /TAXON_ID=3005 /ORGANISM="Rhizosolenia setigera, Strain CCMP 1694" /LENGTH=683 /DNA_ID=CAMNT_0020647355 /DNA_START=146 /DNA_END=2197 /DNA_ORIENTATION=+